MTIERVERFVTKGRMFDSPDKAIEFREELIAKFVESLPGYYQLTKLKDRVRFVQGILDNRKQLRDLLDYDYPSQ